MLVITDSREAISALARSIARRFDLDFVTIALPRAGTGTVFEGGPATIALDTYSPAACHRSDLARIRRLMRKLCTVTGSIPAVIATIRLVPLRVGTKAVGLLAAAGRAVEAGTLDALGGVVAIAIERAQFLEELKTGGDHTAERGVEDGAAGVARTRSAHAAHRHSRGGDQPRGARDRACRTAWSRRI